MDKNKEPIHIVNNRGRKYLEGTDSKLHLICDDDILQLENAGEVFITHLSLNDYKLYKLDKDK